MVLVVPPLCKDVMFGVFLFSLCALFAPSGEVRLGDDGARSGAEALTGGHRPGVQGSHGSEQPCGIQHRRTETPRAGWHRGV